MPSITLAEAVVEGRVELPKPTALAVVNKRYQVVTKGGETTINPPQGVVYLEGNFPKPAAQPVAQMVQKNLAFATPLLPVRVGTKVEFPNQDDGFHNIFSYSPVKRFDLGRYRPEDRDRHCRRLRGCRGRHLLGLRRGSVVAQPCWIVNFRRWWRRALRSG